MAQQHPSVVSSFEFPELALALSEAVDRDDLLRLSIAQREQSWKALLLHLDAAEALSKSIRALHLIETAERSNIDALAAHRAAVIDGRAEVDRTALVYFGSTYRERVTSAMLQDRTGLAAELIGNFEHALEGHRKLILELPRS